MFLALYVVLALALYIVSVPLIGMPLARLNLRMWREKRATSDTPEVGHDLVTFLFFPFYAIDHSDYRALPNLVSRTSYSAYCRGSINERDYLILTAGLWLPRWILHFIWLIGGLLVGMVFGFFILCDRLAPKAYRTVCKIAFASTPKHKRPSCS